MAQRRITLVVVACLLTGTSPAAKYFATPGSNELDELKSDQEDVKSATPEPAPTRSISELPADRENHFGPSLLHNIVNDQATIWASPKHLQFVDLDWLTPLAIATGTMLATDTEYSKHVSNDPSRLQLGNNLSKYGLGAMVGIGSGLYLMGRMHSDDHAEETGILAGEAALNSLGVTYALKNVFGRQRPLQNNYQGNFWSHGDSFPSEHAAAAWSIASIIAHEYPGPLTSFLVYGLAATVSASRITGKQHFPSDVLIGSTAGWLVGQQVYRRRHNPTLGGREWETFAEQHDSGRSPRSRGSPYVPLGSWIYPALDRLAALGYIKLAFLGMRPWTRIECAELVEEAGDNLRANQGGSPESSHAYHALVQEFRNDSETPGVDTEPTLHLESLYTGEMQITGPPLNDSYHFGQTIINNQGRPLQQGFNGVTGFSGWSTAGRFTIYTRGEYQHAPSAAGYSDSTQRLIANIDQTPVQASSPVPATNQFRLLDTYVAANVANWNLAFGKQSLWWGPTEGSALLFSNNAEPIYMFRASRIAPFTMPWIFRRMGPTKLDLFFGKLSGNTYPPRPLIHGEKISFKPTPNLEFGFSRTVELGGVGRAVTPGHVALSYFSLTSPINETPDTDPGKRTGGFDASYRVPLMRNWLTLYTDSLSDDDPSPLAAPHRAGINPGFYLTRLPKISRLDLRVEAVNTNTPVSSSGGHFIYFDSFYRQLYTNKNNIIGSWIGRQGQGIQAWSTYWFSPRSTLQFAYRHAKVANDFIPRGETFNDGSVRANWFMGNGLSFSAFVQCEKWFAPVLAQTPQLNWTTSVQVSFWPHGMDLRLLSALHKHAPELENAVAAQ